MLGLKFFKGLPTDYVIKYVNGRPVAEGAGLTFGYLRHNTQIVVVPLSNRSGDLVFSAVTNDSQSVALQIQFLYRICDPHQAASQFNFSVDANHDGRSYLSRDVAKLTHRAANLVQSELAEQVRLHTFESLQRNFRDIAQATQENFQDSSLSKMLGIEIINVFVLAVRPHIDIIDTAFLKDAPEKNLSPPTSPPLRIPLTTARNSMNRGRRAANKPTFSQAERYRIHNERRRLGRDVEPKITNHKTNKADSSAGNDVADITTQNR